MAINIARRNFITVLGGTVFTWPRTGARATAGDSSNRICQEWTTARAAVFTRSPIGREASISSLIVLVHDNLSDGFEH